MYFNVSKVKWGLITYIYKRYILDVVVERVLFYGIYHPIEKRSLDSEGESRPTSI